MWQLFVDDLRDPDYLRRFAWHTGLQADPELPWTVARSFHEALELMETRGCPALISFDHDLGVEDGEREYSGHDLARWMVDHDLECQGRFIPAQFHYEVHSSNPVGASNIRGALDGYLRWRRQQPWFNPPNN